MNPWIAANPGIFAGIITTVVVLLVIIVVVIVAVSNDVTKEDGIKLVSPVHFYAKNSVNGTDGRDDKGTLTINGVVKEEGLQTVNDLKKYPFQFEAGHPYNQRTKHKVLSFQSSDTSWATYVKRVARKLVIDNTTKGVLEITSKVGPVYIDKSIDVDGLVVRHGGILFVIAGKETVVIRTGFSLTESGGLFQVGSIFKDGMRLRNITSSPISFKMQCATPDNYKYGDDGVLASQYTYKVYAPGVEKTVPLTFSNYTGTDKVFGNTFGARCILATGFNGNRSFAGSVHSPVPYTGTWEATKGDGSNWIGIDHSFTHKAGILNIQDEYPNHWCHLGGKDTYSPGDEFIDVDLAVNWRAGCQIIITTKTEEYSSSTNGDGEMPHWMDWTDEIQKAANQSANEALNQGTNGIEIATIKSVDGTRIILESPLKFTHMNNKATLDRTQDATTIDLDTRVHVGLLTRNIMIESELNTTSVGSGFNLWFHDLPTPKAKGVNIGPGGSILCNYAPPQSVQEVTSFCYDPVYDSSAPTLDDMCNSLKPAPNDTIKGSWVFGTAGLTGSNAMVGAHTMDRYGSSSRFDSVEFFRMGVPANCGMVARYPIHFHMLGFTQWQGYLPADITEVDFRVAECNNSSIHHSYNRWITIHGTCGSHFTNNVCYISYGSGYFTEAGNEIMNSCQHNLMISTLSTRINAYFNPQDSSYIIPLTNTDTVLPSTVWYKNNQNSCFRNIITGSTYPCTAVWLVPQDIARLRDNPSVMIGDSVLKLPGLATVQCVMGNGDVPTPSRNGGAYLSQNLNHKIADPPCYSTDDLINKFRVSSSDGCMTRSVSNDVMPLFLFAENVCYNHAGFVSNFPDTGFQATDVPIIVTPNFVQIVPFWLPSHGQNACTDLQQISATVYTEATFDRTLINGQKRYPFQPISDTDFTAAQQQCNTRSLVSSSDSLPMIMTGCLTHNMGPMIGQLMFGPVWNKSTLHTYNCCFISIGGGTYTGDIAAPSGKALSAMCFGVVGDAVHRFANVYHVNHNLITDVPTFSANPTLFSGDRTFITGAGCLLTEYVLSGSGATRDVAASTYYFTPDITSTIIDPVIYQSVLYPLGQTARSNFYLFDFDTNLYRSSTFNDTTFSTNAPFTDATALEARKYIYMMDDNGALLTNSNALYNNLVVNEFCACFS